MANAFIAVQCFQCSTMQVKQQKKSSNKWSCVICFEKQSIRKVFARSFRAKDIRGFVQNFNMSRQISENCSISSPEKDYFPSHENDGFPAIETGSDSAKRRSDWTRYLDSEEEEDDEEQESTDNLAGAKIVTELPREMFKKARLSHTPLPQKNKGNTLFKPTFSKRKANDLPANRVYRREKENWSFPMILPENSSNGTQDVLANLYATETSHVRSQEIGHKTCQGGSSKQLSKWNNYLELDDQEDNKMVITSKRSPKAYDLLMGDDLDSLFNFKDEKVEEDVHPDFK